MKNKETLKVKSYTDVQYLGRTPTKDFVKNSKSYSCKDIMDIVSEMDNNKAIFGFTLVLRPQPTVYITTSEWNVISGRGEDVKMAVLKTADNFNNWLKTIKSTKKIQSKV